MTALCNTAPLAQRFRQQELTDVLGAGGDTFAPLADGYMIAYQLVLGFGDNST